MDQLQQALRALSSVYWLPRPLPRNNVQEIAVDIPPSLGLGLDRCLILPVLGPYQNGPSSRPDGRMVLQANNPPRQFSAHDRSPLRTVEYLSGHRLSQNGRGQLYVAPLVHVRRLVGFSGHFGSEWRELSSNMLPPSIDRIVQSGALGLA